MPNNTEDQKDLQKNGKTCPCGCGMCGCTGGAMGYGRGFRTYRLLRLLIGLVILIVVFWVGFHVGEFKGEFFSHGSHGFGRGGYGPMIPAGGMMRGGYGTGGAMPMNGGSGMTMPSSTIIQ